MQGARFRALALFVLLHVVMGDQPAGASESVVPLEVPAIHHQEQLGDSAGRMPKYVPKTKTGRGSEYSMEVLEAIKATEHARELGEHFILTANTLFRQASQQADAASQQAQSVLDKQGAQNSATKESAVPEGPSANSEQKDEAAIEQSDDQEPEPASAKSDDQKAEPEAKAEAKAEANAPDDAKNDAKAEEPKKTANDGAAPNAGAAPNDGAAPNAATKESVVDPAKDNISRLQKMQDENALSKKATSNAPAAANAQESEAKVNDKPTEPAEQNLAKLKDQGAAPTDNALPSR